MKRTDDSNSNKIAISMLYMKITSSNRITTNNNNNDDNLNCFMRNLNLFFLLPVCVNRLCRVQVCPIPDKCTHPHISTRKSPLPRLRQHLSKTPCQHLLVIFKQLRSFPSFAFTLCVYIRRSRKSERESRPTSTRKKNCRTKIHFLILPTPYKPGNLLTCLRYSFVPFFIIIRCALPLCTKWSCFFHAAGVYGGQGMVNCSFSTAFSMTHHTT